MQVLRQRNRLFCYCYFLNSQLSILNSTITLCLSHYSVFPVMVYFRVYHMAQTSKTKNPDPRKTQTLGCIEKKNRVARAHWTKQETAIQRQITISKHNQDIELLVAPLMASIFKKTDEFRMKIIQLSSG